MPRKQEAVALILFLCGVTARAFATPATGAAEDKVRISGRVTDFSNQPIGDAKVELLDSRFQTVVGTTTAADGTYALMAPKGNYMALVAVKDYLAKSLEYWAWSVPAQKNLEIHPRFDRIEIYALNAWRPQGALPSYQIYFRPMSLTRIRKKAIEAGGRENLGMFPLLDIAPDLSLKDIAATVDGETVKVLRINKIKEASAPEQDMVGYVIQVALPKRKATKKYRVLIVTLADSETGEKGEASLFFEADPF